MYFNYTKINAKMFREFKSWFIKYHDVLSSAVTILSLPALVISLIIGYHQLTEYLVNPDVELEFIHSSNLTVRVMNNSKEIAEDVVVDFKVIDIDLPEPNLVPIKQVYFKYINSDTPQGKNQLLKNAIIREHRCFGKVTLSCRSGNTKFYWLYIKFGNPLEGFFAKIHPADLDKLRVRELFEEPDAHIDYLVPKEQRIEIPKYNWVSEQ